MVKICTKCKVSKELDEYYFRKDRNVYVTICKTCLSKIHKIEMRNKNPNKLSYNINKKDLYNLYCSLKKSTYEIAKKYKCCNVAIGFYLKKYNIKIRTNSERQKLLHRVCELNPNYKHGKHCTKHYCADCNKEIDKLGRSQRCYKCKGKFYSGKNHKWFGKTPKFPVWTKYKNNKFRSSWEANFAKWCDGSGIKWEYECRTFEVKVNNKDRTYTPDFYLPEFDLWVEVKGWWRQKAKEKFECFLKQYPKINIEVLNGKKLSLLGIVKGEFK